MERSATDPDYGHHDSRMPPETRFVRAILAQAVSDLFGSLSILTPHQQRHERQDALLFLTATSGKWFEQRETFCSLVGIDPGIFRDRIVAILDGRSNASLPFDHGGHADGMAQARALWAARRPQSPPGGKRSPSQTISPHPTALPRIVPKVDPREVAKAKVYSLLQQPIRQSDIVNALAQDLSHHGIMQILNEGIERGEVIRNQDRRYRLAA
jgi:hypothetical protein